MNTAENMCFESVKKQLAFMKSGTGYESSFSRSIPLGNGGGAALPVSAMSFDDSRQYKKILDLVVEGIGFAPGFSTDFDENREKWIESDSNILFLLLDEFFNYQGLLGVEFDTECEILIISVAVSAAESDCVPCARIIEKVFAWAEEGLFVERFKAKSNTLDELLQELGFEEINGMICRGSSFELNAGDRILTAGPSIAAQEVTYSLDAARYGWNSQWSKYLDRFSEFFCDYIGVKYALPTSSCTGAMHIALLALGIGPGDEVLVPDITWVATAQVVNYVGATPVFVDIDTDTWCMDPKSAREKITNKTKAIMPVHLYGHPAKMDEIMAIAKEHDLLVVEDAAPSIGAEFNGQRTGSFGDFSAFSFQGAKLAVTGEGGILLTDNEELYKTAYKLWDQGRVPGTFWIDTVGWKYKMSNIQAALGLGQMERIDTLIAYKRRIFGWYKEFLDGAKGLKLQHEADWAHSIYWMTNITLTEESEISRDGLIHALADANIDSRPVFPVISQYPIWPTEPEPCPNASQVSSSSINLPSGHCLKKSQIKHVSEVILKALGC